MVVASCGLGGVWVGGVLPVAGAAAVVELAVAAGVAAEVVGKVTSSLLAAVVTASAEAAGFRRGVLAMAPCGSKRVWGGGTLSAAGVAVSVEKALAAGAAKGTVMWVTSSLFVVVVTAAVEAAGSRGGGWSWPSVGL